MRLIDNYIEGQILYEDLYLDGRKSSKKTLPDNLIVLGTMYIESCEIDMFPANCYIHNLEIKNSNINFKKDSTLEVYSDVKIFNTLTTTAPSIIKSKKTIQIVKCNGFENTNLNMFASDISRKNNCWGLDNDSFLITKERGSIMHVQIQPLSNPSRKSYVITTNDDCSICDNYQEAKKRLKYTFDRNTNKKNFKWVNNKSILTKKDLFQIYTSIAKSCKNGTIEFIEENYKRELYTIEEAIEIAKDVIGIRAVKKFIEEGYQNDKNMSSL